MPRRKSRAISRAFALLFAATESSRSRKRQSAPLAKPLSILRSLSAGTKRSERIARLCSREFLVFQPVRDDRVDPEPPLLVFLVIGKVALEPFDMTFTFEGEHMRGDAVQKEAIVADDYGAAGKIFERVFDCAQRVHIEI